MSSKHSVVQFNNKNYVSWEFKFQTFRDLDDLKELNSWEGNDAKIDFGY